MKVRIKNFLNLIKNIIDEDDDDYDGKDLKWKSLGGCQESEKKHKEVAQMDTNNKIRT